MPYLFFYRRGQELLHLDLSQVVTPKRPLVVGSKVGNYVVPDKGIAPTQFEIALEGDGYRLSDRSGQGTEVDGEPKESVLLADGVNIQLGSFTLVYQLALPEGMRDDGSGSTLVDGFAPPPLPKALWITAQHKDGGAPLRIDLTDKATIGSGEGCDLRLAGSTVSAKHLELARENGVVRLRDLGSTNGSWFGAMRVVDIDLPLGVRIRVGDWELWVSGRDNSIGDAPRAAVTAGGLVTSDPGMLEQLRRVEAIAGSDCTVLIQGETGTGKELFAKAIHERSKRAGKKMITVNCGVGRSRENFSTKLAGFEKGSFTGADKAQPGTLALADGGTVFLDEVREIPVDQQPSLLRAVEYGEIEPLGAPEPRHVDVRYIAATHYDLGQAIRAGDFREDLYHRLVVVTFLLPPLRYRKGDIPILWDYFTMKLSGSPKPMALTDAARAKLMEHDYPGNVRELWNVANRALLFEPGPIVDAELILFDESFDAPGEPEPAGRPGQAESIEVTGKTLAQVVAAFLAATMRAHKGNRTAACRQLGIDPKRLRRMLEEYGLTKVGL